MSQNSLANDLDERYPSDGKDSQETDLNENDDGSKDEKVYNSNQIQSNKQNPDIIMHSGIINKSPISSIDNQNYIKLRDNWTTFDSTQNNNFNNNNPISNSEFYLSKNISHDDSFIIFDQPPLQLLENILHSLNQKKKTNNW